MLSEGNDGDVKIPPFIRAEMIRASRRAREHILVERLTMESLSELQNPLLDKNSKHMVKADYGYRATSPAASTRRTSLITL
ncbi:hypothetical protein HF521_012389 [Silurus meridionalis]|uniref:Uncharacterized protein n=1 Tax=Silurus meridionalis TaxID=175797 RepID=A0A8T0AGE1_SILME|nr:hypothetical protein HF521_012389 [Silurus meridionalis]